MKKQELVDIIATKSSINKIQAQIALEQVTLAITNSLRQGKSVRFVGFGTFNIKCRKARMGRNPRTGEPMQIPMRTVPVFTAGKALKGAVKYI